MVKLSYVYRAWVSPGEEQTLSADGGEQGESDGPGSNPRLNKRIEKSGDTVNLKGLDRGLGYAPLRRPSAGDGVVPAAGVEMSSAASC